MIHLVILALVVSILSTGTKTRRCETGSDIAHSASCAREGRILREVARRCRRVLDSDDIRETPWSARIRDRWDGSVHQLVDGGPAPAVTTHKSDIRVCLDGASSIDALVFVCLHELSHIAVDSYGHTPEFWQCMASMTQAAIREGVYTHRDDSTVCGSQIGSIPKRSGI